MDGDREQSATPRSVAKEIDSWWTVLAIDPVAVRLVPVLARRRWITPTRITLTALVLGLVAAALFLEGPLWLAAVVFELRFMCDCLDGKLARYTGRSSAFGAAVDVTCDLVATTLCLGAFAVRTATEVDGGSTIRMAAGVGMVIAFGLAHWAHQFLHTAYPTSGRFGSAPAEGSFRARLARRRLQAYPTGIELETLLLFIAPWFGTSHAAWFFAVGCAFYGMSGLDDIRRLLTRARQADEGGETRPRQEQEGGDVNPLVFVVLAAGRGSRLGDETASKPKWLLDIGGETIADRQLSAIADGWRAGDALVVVTGYEADAVRDFLADRADLAPRLLHNPHFLDRNNWYSVLIALDDVAERWPDHSVVILNSDLFAPKEVLTGLVRFARCGDPTTAALALDCNRPLSHEAMKVELTGEAPVRCCAIGKAGGTSASGEYVGLSFVGREATVALRAVLRGFEADPSAANNWYEHGYDVLMRSDAVSFLPWTIPLVDWVEIDDGDDLARARQAEPAR